jgi:hypothetical protein
VSLVKGLCPLVSPNAQGSGVRNQESEVIGQGRWALACLTPLVTSARRRRNFGGNFSITLGNHGDHAFTVFSQMVARS